MDLIGFERVVVAGHVFFNFWAPTFHQGRDATYGEHKRTLRAFHAFEATIKQDQEVRGWVTWVLHIHPRIIRLVGKLGGQPFFVLGDRTWFIKEV